MRFYVAVNGHHEGPFDIEQLRARHIKRTTLVWNEMMSDWTPAGKVDYLVDNLFSAGSVASTTLSTQQDVPDIRQTIRRPVPVDDAQQGAVTGQTGTAGGAQSSPDNATLQNPRPPRPTSWLIPAILATIFCCLPFGLMSVIYASKVDNLYADGRYEEAERASRQARNWFIGAVVCVAAFIFVYFIVPTILGIGVWTVFLSELLRYVGN